MIQALEEVQVEHEEYKKALEVAEINAKQKRAELEKAIAECEELEVEIARNNRLQTASRREGAAIKKKVTDLNDQVQTAQWALQEVELEEEKLRAQIVSSPERRQAELFEKKNQLQSEKDECNRLEEAVQECKIKYSNALKLYQEFSDCIKDIDELKEEAQKYNDIVYKLNQTQKEISDMEKATDELNSQITDAERDRNRIEEKIKAQTLQHQMNMQAIQESMDNAKKELLQVEKDRRDAMARIEAGEKEVQALNALIEQEQIKTDAEIQNLITNYKKLELKFRERNDKREKQILSLSSTHFQTTTTDENNKENNIVAKK